MAKLITISLAKLNNKQKLSTNEDWIINKKRVVISGADTSGVAATLVEYNSDGHHSARLDNLHIDNSIIFDADTITVTAESLDGRKLDTPVGRDIEAENIIYIFPRPTNKSRIVYVKRIEAGQPIVGSIDASESVADVALSASTVGGSVVQNSVDITASGGAAGTELSGNTYNWVTGAAGGTRVHLPTIAPGMKVIVKNDSGGVISVYSESTGAVALQLTQGSLNATATNQNMNNGTCRVYEAVSIDGALGTTNQYRWFNYSVVF